MIVDVPEAMMTDYCRASNRLILLDYDGTLAPLKVMPAPVEIDEEMKWLITDLTSDYRNSVIIISGRRTDELEMSWKDVPVSLASEHGGFFKKAGGSWQAIFSKKVGWMKYAYPALRALAFHYSGSLVERKQYSLAWHYRSIADIVNRDIKNQILQAIQDLPCAGDFLVYDGEFTIELRTPGVDKGTFAEKWIGNRAFDFIMAVGDGDTDEDLFRVLRGNDYTFRVGAVQHSWANHRLQRQQDVIELLQLLRQASNIESDTNGLR